MYEVYQLEKCNGKAMLETCVRKVVNDDRFM